MASRRAINEFLGCRRIAVVGVSRNTAEFANTIYRKLKEKGYEVVPVNPKAEQVEGDVCYPTLGAVPGAVDGVLVLLPPGQNLAVVQECLAVGVKRVWFLKPSKMAADVASRAGMTVVDGACPHMFLGGGFPHNLHRVFTRLEV
ncbi:MAG: CoA-binding protein [Symbiobacteriaceae bacterium]|nr:CoA-binding protein [Symbiobacteriaceae bacterium]